MPKLTRAQKATLAKLANAYVETDEHLSNHRRLCEVCKHPACYFIQEAFLQWTSPATIMKKYGLKSRAAIYHHAHAFKLFEVRDTTLRYALGHIIEQADRVSVTARDVIHAAYTYAHINDTGLWMQPESRSEVVVSRDRAGDEPSTSPRLLDSTFPRLPAKPTKRRRRSASTPSLEEVSKSQPKASSDFDAAYSQAAAPDPPVAGKRPTWQSIANKFFGKVPRPNRDPNSNEKVYFHVDEPTEDAPE